MLTNATYLEDSMVERMGYKIYGTPWTADSLFGAMTKPHGDELHAIWKKIPSDTDILLTHSPPFGTHPTLTTPPPNTALSNAVFRDS